MASALQSSVVSLGAAIGSGEMDGELRVNAAAHLCTWGLVGFEASSKGSPALQGPLDACFSRVLKPYFNLLTKTFAAESFVAVASRTLALLEGESEEEVALGCPGGISNDLGR